MWASIWTYPWDLHDEGVETALRVIRDEGRLTGISLAANYHTSKCFLPHNPRRKVFFNDDGALEFVPRLERYGRIRPRVSSLAREVDTWGEVARLADRMGMRLSAWLIGLHSTYLGTTYPHCTIVNAFGDHYRHSLCPNHPDVRAYVIGLATDIASQYPVAAIELESVEFMGLRHGFHHEKIAVPLDAWHTFLLDLCFCDHCGQAAMARGIDVSGLRDLVRRTVTAYLDADLPPPNGDDTIQEATRLALEHDDFRGYLAMRCSTVSTLVEAIRESLDRERSTTELYCFAAPVGGWREGSDPVALRRAVGGFIMPYARTGREMIATMRRLQLMLGDETPLIAAIDATYPQTATSDDVVDRVRACHTMGVLGVNFYNYGLMRRSNLQAIGRALRDLPS